MPHTPWAIRDASRSQALIREGLSELPEEPEFAIDRANCLLSGSTVSLAAGAVSEAISRLQLAQQLLNLVPIHSWVLDFEVSTSLGDSFRFVGRNRDACAQYEQTIGSLTIFPGPLDVPVGYRATARSGGSGDRGCNPTLNQIQEAAQPGTFSVLAGRAYLALGRALQAQRKIDEARTNFVLSVQHLEKSVGSDHAETRAARQASTVQ